jgi:hypothetical protein
MTTLAELTCDTDTAGCCPAKFDGRATQIPDCFLRELRATRTCGSVRELSRDWGAHSVLCYYSVATGALVGAIRTDDVGSYCQKKSFSESAGLTPACDSESRTPLACGADAGAHAD